MELVQHVTLARALQQEKKKIKTVGEPSIGRRRRSQKKKKVIGFQKLSPKRPSHVAF